MGAQFVNKGQGITIGAILAASLLLKPGIQTAPASVEPNPSKPTIRPGTLIDTNGAKGRSSDGPWLASCRYWAPVRDVREVIDRQEVAKEQTPEIKGELDNNNHELDVYLDLKSTERDWGCGKDAAGRWGLPNAGGSSGTAPAPYVPHITALIATVPDPVHTHLALSFDRAIVAILEAASDNHYVSSFYWLPWTQHSDAGHEGGVGEPESGHDPEREQEPGLIVLRHVPLGKVIDPSESYYDVIYLFLVAETPTQGVDGFQLAHAFAYESELKNVLAIQKPCDPTKESDGTPANEPRFRRAKDCNVSIIGPLFTGSAPSLRAGIENAHARDPSLQIFDVKGATATPFAVSIIQAKLPDQDLEINYYSFDIDTRYAETQLLDRLKSGGFWAPNTAFPHVAVLAEDNTALGSANALNDPFELEEFRYPREISLLRNAEIEAQSNDSGSGNAPSPYLRLSAKDQSRQDELPQFSRDNTPLSQEAELMILARQLKHDQVHFLLFSTPSSPLDQVFLARFLRRSSPDTRLVFLDSDVLMVRDVDSVPFLGSITVSPFPMTEIDRRVYSDMEGVAYYNAASMTFWESSEVPKIKKALDFAYDDLLSAGAEYHPSLWATVIGTDGYYPLAQLKPCATDNPRILPAIDERGKMSSEPCTVKKDANKQFTFPYPVSKLWIGITILIALTCIVHTAMLRKARYWSTLTGNLALDENSEVGARAIYLLIGGTILFLMSFMTACPALALHSMSRTSWHDAAAAVGLLTVGILAYAYTIRKTFPPVWQGRRSSIIHLLRKPSANLGATTYGLIFVTCVAVTAVWSFLCWSNTPTATPSFRGFGFSYRAIHPESGISPLVPVLLLLVTWHWWSLLQTARLRFSSVSKPGIPGKLNGPEDSFFVPSELLSDNRAEGGRSLVGNLTDTFVAERLFWRGNQIAPARVKIFAFILTVGIPILLAFLPLFNGIDHFLWDTHSFLPSPYEFVVGLLFYPLFVMAVLGWFRVLIIWFSLRRDLLDRLENLPIRYAFNRIKGMGWMVLLQQGAVYEHWRDMARSLESIRQILHQGQMQSAHRLELLIKLRAIKTEITDIQIKLRKRAGGEKRRDGEPSSPELMGALEGKFASFAKELLADLLAPHWANERVGLVESEMSEDMPVKARRSEIHAADQQITMEVFAEPEQETKLIVAAEEYLVLRYIALIRAVLTNLRHVMAFVSAFFVLAVVAWNSYPFQPRELVDWLITVLLGLLGTGLIWVFAQMHRSPILSRTTDTKANELGWDFYLRVVSLGALPLLTWLAYSFPELGGAIYRFLQPGVSVLK